MAKTPGFPPQPNFMSRAERPGGFGTVPPKPPPKVSLGGASKLQSMPSMTPKLARGGTIPGMGSGLSTSSLSKMMPRPPRPGGPKIKGPF